MMPAAKRRRVAAPSAAATKAQQSTLSFRSSKAGRQSLGKDGKVAKVEKVEIADDEPVAVQEVLAPPPVREQIIERKAEVNDVDVEVADEEEEEGEPDEEQLEEQRLDKLARAMPESKIKSYWAKKEAERKAPRVHQQGLGVREKVLREFDMSSRFGPSVGIQRLARWRRAQSLGMDPPLEILAVLLKEEDAAQQNKPVSSGGTVKKDFQRSIIDELTLSSRLKGDGLEA